MGVNRLAAIIALGLAPGAAQELAPIHAIQGSSVISPLANRSVTTSGIVTARRAGGFFIQARDSDWDADWNTSEGLYVFTSSSPAAGIQSGVEVRVTGTVVEFGAAGASLTEISRPSAITVLSSGNALPAPLELAREQLQAGWGLQNAERFEGMRVTFRQVRVTQPSFGNGLFFAVPPGTPRPQQSLDWDGSPELIRVDSAGQPGNRALIVATGASLAGLSGVLDFGSGAWTLLLDPGAGAPELPRASPLIRPAAGEFTIASMNVARFADDVDDPLISDPVATTEEYQGRLRKFALAANSILWQPDIIALEEVEKLSVAEAMAARLEGYRAYLEEGSDPSSIDVGFLIKTSRVSVRSVQQFGKDTTYVRPDGRTEILNDRPPLVLRAVIDQHRNITVVVNHLRSKSGLDDPTSGPRILLKRRLQAEFLRDLLINLRKETPDEAVVAVGDFNSFQFEPATMGVLAANGLTQNLTDWLRADHNYSYLFNGVAQTLDHVLVAPPARPLVSRIAFTRLNASYPEALASDYTRPERLSDHEWVMAYFLTDPKPFTAASITDNATFLAGPQAPESLVSLFGAGLPDRGIQVDGAEPTAYYRSPAQFVFRVPAGAAGSMRVSLGDWSVEVPVVAWNPAIDGIEATPGGLQLHVSGVNAADVAVTIGNMPAPLRWAAPRVLIADTPDYLPRGVPLPVVVTSGEYSSPRSRTVILQ